MKPNDRRNFVHKRLIGAVGGFIGGGGIGGAIRGFRSGGRRRGGSPRPPTERLPPMRRPPTSTMPPPGIARPDVRTRVRQGSRGGSCPPGKRRIGPFCVGFQQPRGPIGVTMPGGPGSCPPGTRWKGPSSARPNGACVPVSGGQALAGLPTTTGTAMVAAGSRGAYAPSVDMRTVRECLPGDVLGRDGLCHSKADISNKNRAHPRGRRPLGTPGEMAALAKAAAFGRRMENTVKRMQKIGVLKKPRRGAPRRQPQRLLGPGGPSIINVE